MKNLRLITINTTAFSDENFYLVTNLTDHQIKSVLSPIIEKERQENEYYDNFELISELLLKYPNNIIQDYTLETIDSINL